MVNPGMVEQKTIDPGAFPPNVMRVRQMLRAEGKPMELTVETVVAIVVGAVLLVALLRGWYLVGRSLGGAEEAIGEYRDTEKDRPDEEH